jgi:hypothetical protein
MRSLRSLASLQAGILVGRKYLVDYLFVLEKLKDWLGCEWIVIWKLVM